MITEDEYRDKVNIDITSENLPKLENFLKINKDTIKSGLEYIEGNYFKLGFEDGLKKIGYKLDIVPGERLNEYKTDPTETSSENMIIRVTQLYLDRNPWFTRFEDEFGWSYHEFVHAIIFSGNLPKEYLEICSPFGYPFTTDEIYTFGFQIKHIDNLQYNNLVRYEYNNNACNNKSWVTAFDIFRDIIKSI